MGKVSVEISAFDMSNISVLKHKEMCVLFERYKTNNDLLAKDELVKGNLKLVLSLLRGFQNKVDNIDDLFQIGCIGLIKAIDNFDLSHNVKFSTYAVPMILGEIKRYLRDNNLIRVSRSTKELSYKILNYKDEYLSLHGKDPTNAQIASYFNISDYEVYKAVMSLSNIESIYEPIYSDGDNIIYLLDQIENEKESVSKEDLSELKKALLLLKERERNILLSRYIVGKTQSEIAKDISISQAQVSRIEQNAIEHMKKLLK